jgi:hypothetical protein
MHDICPACIKEVEAEYEKCVKYLREYRQCTLQELSEATEVSIRQITRFIREGRISIANNPNMSYSCEMCGTMIREGNICESCRQKLIRDVNKTLEEEKRKQQLLQQENHASYNIKDRLRERH